VTGDASDASTGGDDLRERSGEHRVDGLVTPVAAIELYEHRRRHSNGSVSPMRAPHRGSHALVPRSIDRRTGECGERFAVED
jgi:hypothetical protein